MDDDVRAGQAIYNPVILRAYDLVVLGLICSLIWRCPASRLRALYHRHVGASHIDVGVGTGYFLDRARWPVERPRVALVDLNPNTLAHVSRRIERFDVTTQIASVLEPLPLPEREFDSAAANFLLHCVPGDIQAKAVAFDHLAACVKPGGTIFGSTILSHGVRNPWQARFLLDRNNASGVFHNAQDRLEDLETELGKRFAEHEIAVQGSVALFAATVG